MNIWMSPTDQPAPFGTYGQVMDNATRYPQLDHTRWLLIHIFTSLQQQGIYFLLTGGHFQIGELGDISILV